MGQGLLFQVGSYCDARQLLAHAHMLRALILFASQFAAQKALRAGRWNKHRKFGRSLSGSGFSHQRVIAIRAALLHSAYSLQCLVKRVGRLKTVHWFGASCYHDQSAQSGGDAWIELMERLQLLHTYISACRALSAQHFVKNDSQAEQI